MFPLAKGGGCRRVCGEQAFPLLRDPGHLLTLYATQLLGGQVALASVSSLGPWDKPCPDWGSSSSWALVFPILH